MQHLFIECPVAVECWKQMASMGGLTWEPQATIADTIYNWKKACPWKEKRSKLTQRAWNTFPLTLLWRLWLARNGKVFQAKDFSIRKICHKAKLLALETITNNTTGRVDATSYSIEERNLISYILENNSRAMENCRRGTKTREEASTWKLRLK